jgi:hypothetical protein
MKVLVNFQFIFSPKEVWGSITMLENDLASFFRKKGLEAEIVNCGVDEPNKRMIIINKAQTTMPKLSKDLKNFKLPSVNNLTKNKT